MDSASHALERISRDQQKQNVQDLVTACLEAKQALLVEKRKIEEKLRVVNMDLEDLKDGRLDRILERQLKDPRSAEISEFSIVEGQADGDKNGKWYKPFIVKLMNTKVGRNQYIELNCSVTKDYAVGTYIIGPEKEVIHFRK